MNVRAICFPPPDQPVQAIVATCRNTCAVELVEQRGRAKLGSIRHLPPGVELRVYGEGFSSRTAKVGYGSQVYFVFRDDLERDIT